jgi:hypothetical protein
MQQVTLPHRFIITSREKLSLSFSPTSPYTTMASRSSSTRATNGSAKRYVLLFMSCPSSVRAPLRRAVPSPSTQSCSRVPPSTAVSVLLHNPLRRRSRRNTKRSLLAALVTTQAARRPPRRDIHPPAARVTTPMRRRHLPHPPLRPPPHTASTTPTRLTGTLPTQSMPIPSTRIPPRPRASRLTPTICSNNLTVSMPSSITSE